MLPNKVFLDTSYAIALVSQTDQHHQRAISLSLQLENQNITLVTTRAVLVETGNALAKLRYRQVAIELLSEIESDPQLEIIPLSELLYQRGLQLYRERQDKEWGITDCISFVVMDDLNLTAALTADIHFQQAGFHALLKQE